jgi:hypothetical protein
MGADAKIFAQISEIHEGRGRSSIKLRIIPSGNVRSHKVSNFPFDPKINQFSANLGSNTSFETFSTSPSVFLHYALLL